MQIDPTHKTTETSDRAVAAAGHEVRREAIRFAKILGLFLVLFLLLRGLVVEWVPVNGPSMMPNLQEGDRILVYKLPQTLRALPLLGNMGRLDAGDIVVFDSPADQRRYVKRVIASGPLNPPRNVANAMSPVSESTETLVQFEDGSVYVNNRRLEEPWLTEEARQVHGKCQAALKPGEYFVLGDNRPVSKDSRRIGPVNQGEITGRAVLRFWPPSRFGLL
ncbi:MAG: signal peptidase I [Candidatus Hydrogenedentes bacterium]|nr:signal peptidase I [Candidatus Hydrogenedentota bacterium]